MPEAPTGRPYVFVNMVSTLDGKTTLGGDHPSASGIGSETDQKLMHRLQEIADGILIGAGTLRAGNIIYPIGPVRAAISASCDLPLENRFFRDDPERLRIFTVRGCDNLGLNRFCVYDLAPLPQNRLDVLQVLAILREREGVRRLLVEGGARLNFELLSRDVLDEIFLTVAPKLTGGQDRPTVIGGAGLDAGAFRRMRLISIYRHGSEIYMRYRRNGR
ncbi:MAG: RibD family protein [Armatimonadetes bacterium]|nr:RibD family protein [Armatimonadota bacterium]